MTSIIIMTSGFSLLPVIFARLFITFLDQGYQASPYDYPDYDNPVGNNTYYGSNNNNGVRQASAQFPPLFTLKGDNLCVGLDEYRSVCTISFGLYRWACDGDLPVSNAFQFERVETSTAGYFSLKNRFSGQCLVAPKDGSSAFQCFCSNIHFTHYTQFFTVEDVSGGTRIKSYYGKYLTRDTTWEARRAISVQDLNASSKGQFWTIREVLK